MPGSQLSSIVGTDAWHGALMAWRVHEHKWHGALTNGHGHGQEALKDLNARLEQSAKDAEAASSAEASDALPEGAPPHLEIALPLPDAPGTAAGAPSAGHRSNPYAEYKALLSSRSTASARSDGEASDSASVFSEPSGLDVDNAAVRSRIAKLRAESELLRKCAKEGARGDFAAFRKALVSKNS